MSYLGNAPESVFTEMKYQDLTGGSGTSFTLNQAVSNPQEIEVFVNNVRQEPSAAYSVSGTTLTMTESVGASEDFYVVFQGMAQGSATHPATQSLEAASVTSNGNIKIPLDGSSITNHISVGASNDLKIYHNGSASYVYDAGTGNLQLVSNNVDIRGANFSRKMISANDEGTVELYYNNSKKFETTSAGVDVTGDVQSSGNLLVGRTTNSGYSANSVVLSAVSGNGSIFDGTGNTVAFFNRRTSDGEILNFSKDGTTVGKIGSSGGQAFIGGTTKGIRFSTLGFTGTDNAGTLSDGAIDIGTSSHRIKDLYLSGGAYLGGTGSANHLDDYEEGTWTPTLSGASTAGSITYQAQSGFYIKVGKIVHIDMRIIYTAFSGSAGTARISGLPFGVSGATNYAPISSNWITFSNTFDTAGFPVFYGVPGGTYFHGLVSKTGAAWVDWPSSNFHLSGGTKYLNLTATYQTS